MAEQALTPPVGFMKVRLGVDPTFGHPVPGPIVTTLGSITVFTDQIAQNRVTDPYIPHHGPPPPLAATGSVTVYTDQLMTHRFLDSLTCGDINAAGSITAYAGN